MRTPEDIPNTDVATTDYPYGKLRDDAVKGDGTGTPVRADWLQDMYYALLAVMTNCGVVPNGVAETATASQMWTALTTYFSNASNLSSGTLDEARLPYPATQSQIVTGDCATAGTYKFALVGSNNLHATDVLRIVVSDNNPTASARKLCSFLFSPDARDPSKVGTILSSLVNADTTLNPNGIYKDNSGLYLYFPSSYANRTVTIEKIGKTLDDGLTLITPTTTYPSLSGLRTKSILTTNIDDFFGSEVPLLDSANTFTDIQTISKNGASLEIDPLAASAVYITADCPANDATLGFDAKDDGSSGSSFRFGRYTNTSGIVNFTIFKGNGANAPAHIFYGNDGKISLNNQNATLGVTGARLQGLSTGSGTDLVIDASGYILKKTSSKRLKTDIETMELEFCENIIDNIRPVFYRNIDPSPTYPDDWSYWGVIAEELAEIDPRLVNFGYWPEDYEMVKEKSIENEQYKDENGEIKIREVESIIEVKKLKTDAKLSPTGVMYDRLAVVAIKAIQADRERIASLEKRLEALEKKLI